MNNSGPDASNPMRDPAEIGGQAPLTDGPDDDVAWVFRAQQGDAAAFDVLVTRHRGKIHAMIRNLIHNETDAWDLSQEVFIKAWSALPRFESKARFTTWLYRIAHNTVYDWTRKRRIESTEELDDGLLARERIDPASMTTPTGGEAPDEQLSNSELGRKISAALAKLSPEHREAVLLKDVQGLAYKEIAEVMSCSIGTVMSRLFYARQKLQILLKDEYDTR
jgi:RNA polymerase sigma-70 factor (ECF subfamily)